MSQVISETGSTITQPVFQQQGGADTRTRLLAHGLEAMLRHGYDGVGIGGILGAAGVPKGSFYHFFASKEDFCLALLDVYQAHYAAMRDAIFTDAARSPLDRLDAYFAALEADHTAQQPLGGCFYGVLAQTAGARGAMLRARLSDVFASWQDHLAGLLEAARTAGETDPDLDPAATAAFLIDAYEGMVIRSKADGGTALADGFARLRRFALAPLRKDQSATRR